MVAGCHSRVSADFPAQISVTPGKATVWNPKKARTATYLPRPQLHLLFSLRQLKPMNPGSKVDSAYADMIFRRIRVGAAGSATFRFQQSHESLRGLGTARLNFPIVGYMDVRNPSWALGTDRAVHLRYLTIISLATLRIAWNLCWQHQYWSFCNCDGQETVQLRSLVAISAAGLLRNFRLSTWLACSLQEWLAVFDPRSTYEGTGS